MRVISSEYLVRGQAGRNAGHSFFNSGDRVVAGRRRRNDGAHHGTDGLFDFLKRLVDLCVMIVITSFCLWHFGFTKDKRNSPGRRRIEIGKK